MPTRAPVSEFEFILNEIIDYEQIIKTSRFKDTSSELVSQILSEAARMCDDVLSPLNRVGDLHPAIISNGVVKTSPGFGDGYHAVAEILFSPPRRNGSSYEQSPRYFALVFKPGGPPIVV